MSTWFLSTLNVVSLVLSGLSIFALGYFPDLTFFQVLIPDRPSKSRRYVIGGCVLAIGIFATLWIEPLKRTAQMLIQHGWSKAHGEIMLGEVGAYLFTAILCSFIISVAWGIVGVLINGPIQSRQDRRDASDI